MTSTCIHIRGGTVHVSPPIQKGAPAAMQRCLITASRRTANANGDTEAGALMFGSLYFILIKYQLAVKLEMLELMCVRALWRDYFNCFLIPAESTLNTLWREEQTTDTVGVASGLGEAFIQQK